MRLTLVAGNYLKKYINRTIAEATGVSVKKPFQGWREIRKKKWVFGEHRPWTDAAKDLNRPLQYKKKVFLEPIADADWKVFKGDKVEVLTGPDKGKQGIVNYIIPERNWCYVEGLNCKYRWVNKTASHSGMVMKEEKPLLVTSDIILVDPSDSKPTVVEWRFTEEGERVRVSARTGRIIPKSKMQLDESYDNVKISTYIEKDKDTRGADVKAVTFKPTLSTFEDDIMQQMGIKDERKPAKTYWY